MQNASTKPQGGQTDEMRMAFVAPRALIAELRVLAKANQRSASAELRKLIEDAIAREPAA